MKRWSEFADLRPDLAAMANAMFYEHGIGLGFLATVRRDGGPRVHPICPLPAGDLYGFIIRGPKLADLRRDARYALHSETFAPRRQDDGVFLAGTIKELHDPTLREGLVEQFLAERKITEPWPGLDTQALVKFEVERVLITMTEARDGFPVGNTIWHE